MAIISHNHTQPHTCTFGLPLYHTHLTFNQLTSRLRTLYLQNSLPQINANSGLASTCSTEKNVKQLYFLFSLEGSTLMLINMQLYDTKHCIYSKRLWRWRPSRDVIDLEGVGEVWTPLEKLKFIKFNWYSKILECRPRAP